MADYLTNDADLKAVADAIRAKGGTSAPLTYPDGFVSAIGAISSSNHRHYEYDNPAAVSGSGNYITVVSGDETLKQVRSLDTLLVIYHIAGEASCVKNGVGCNVLGYLPSPNTETSHQEVIRLNASGVVAMAYPVNRIADDTSISTGSGRIHITPEGDLRIYGNTSAYPILAGKVTVDVIW